MTKLTENRDFGGMGVYSDMAFDHTVVQRVIGTCTQVPVKGKRILDTAPQKPHGRNNAL